MIAYRLFECVAIAGFLLYSLRQVLPLFPNAAMHIARWAKAGGVPPTLLLPARFARGAAESCSGCNTCSGCGPKTEDKVAVITLHRSTSASDNQR